MASKRISDLPVKTVPGSADLIPIVDTQFGVDDYISKKTTVAGLLSTVPATITAQIGTLMGEALGLATLNSAGKLNTNQLPTLVITDTFTAANEAAMLALVAEQGDVCVRTDISKSLILLANPATLLSNWQELLSPPATVTSVNGYVGTVILDNIAVGAAATAHTHIAADVTDFDAAVAATPPQAHAHGNISNAGTIATAPTYLNGPYALLVAGVDGVVGAMAPLLGGGLSFASDGDISCLFGTLAGEVCQGDDSRLSDTRDPNAHVHGNISNAGAIGSTANLFVTTDTDGVLSVGGSLLTNGTAVYTTGSDAQIYTTGVNAHISTNGSNAEISTTGGNAHIRTNGDSARIYTTGNSAHIYTDGSSAHIQTRFTFNLYDGTYTTTLSHAPTDNRAIVFPDAAGTVALNNDARFSDTRDPNAHAHGYISNAGAIGVDAGLFVTTSAGGVLDVQGPLLTNGTAVYTQGNNAQIYTLGQYGSFSTAGSDAIILTQGPNAHISTSGANANIYTEGTDAEIYTSGATAHIYTQGSGAQIYTTGDSATIYTNGDTAHIYTQGASAEIYTNGTVATISTQGSNAYIFTGGQYATITTSGTDAHIYTNGSNAHIQTRSTFNLFDGSYTTTLSHAPTADRAIVFPDAAGTVALDNDARFSDSRTPTGAAAGGLTGTYPNPTLSAANAAAVNLFMWQNFR